MKSQIRIGTRGSPLALYQAQLLKACLRKHLPMIAVEVVKIKTGGDMIRRGAHANPLLTKRMYTKEIEDALAAGGIDLAVHSAKDMAAVLPDGLKIGAVLESEDPRDCLVSQEHKKFSALAMGARIGTSSLRRKMQLLRLNPELIVEEVHGNVETRIRKMEEGHFDAVVLAYAGLKRLGLANYVTEVFPGDRFLPAPGQGIIVAQCRIHDKETEAVLEPIHHDASMKRLSCERAFLRRLEGGCQLPCGVSTQLSDSTLKCSAILLATEGHDWAEAQHEGPLEHAEKVGEELADRLLDKGGREILEKIKANVKSSS